MLWVCYVGRMIKGLSLIKLGLTAVAFVGVSQFAPPLHHNLMAAAAENVQVKISKTGTAPAQITATVNGQPIPVNGNAPVSRLSIAPSPVQAKSNDQPKFNGRSASDNQRQLPEDEL
jgi:hypothetical protein